MNDLVVCIDLLKNRIKHYHAKLSAKESQTRISLIDPLLKVLEWNTADPSMVTVEYSIGRGRADYALLRRDLSPIAVIEAKSLGSNLEDISNLNQLISNANMAGVSYAVLTNGSDWIVYDVFKQAPLEERKLLDVSLEQGAINFTVMQLLYLWRENLLASSPVTAKAVDVNALELRENSKEWISVADYTTSNKPTKVKFWNGVTKDVRFWKDVLEVTVKVLYDESLLTDDDLPIGRWGNTVKKLINSKPKDSDGTEWRSHRCVTNNLYVYTHLSATDILFFCNRLLKDFDKDPKTDMKLR